MPHNFYLHSGICQVRKINSRNQEEIRQAVKYTETDSNIQLTIAFIINSRCKRQITECIEKTVLV